MPPLMLLLLLVTLPWPDEQDTTGPAQSASADPPATGSTAAEPQQPAAPSPQIAQPAPSPARRLTPFVMFVTGFDSNINHDANDIDAFGASLGVGGIYRNDPQRPTLEVQYQAGLHRYTGTDTWNRLSHFARAAWDRRLSRRFALETVGEMSIKGSTEDRELGNEATLSPRLEFRLRSSLRIRGFGAWRVKRYDDSPDRNAFNRYAGLELIGRPRPGVRWEAGGRYELNAAESIRQRYLRWTWYGGLVSPVTPRDRILADMRYRRQRYPYRLVDVRGGPDVPRRDWRAEPEIAWLHSVDDDMDLKIGYAFNGRESNDPRRDYRSHEVMINVLHRW